MLIVLALALLQSADLGAEVAGLADQEHLPLAFVSAVAPRLEVRFHRFPSLAMAYYAPSPAGPEPHDSEVVHTTQLPPQLFLYEPYYRDADGSLIDPASMTPDVVEYWSHALILAYLHLEVVEKEGVEYAGLIARRAAQLYPDLEPDAALGAYITAVAGFGSHVVSVANEIERIKRRRPERDLCPLLRSGSLHFGVWEQAFDRGEFTGIASEPGGEAYPSVAIERQDKDAFVRHVLLDWWNGDSEHDFAGRYCGTDEELDRRPAGRR